MNEDGFGHQAWFRVGVRVPGHALADYDTLSARSSVVEGMWRLYEVSVGPMPAKSGHSEFLAHPASTSPRCHRARSSSRTIRVSGQSTEYFLSVRRDTDPWFSVTQGGGRPVSEVSCWQSTCVAGQFEEEWCPLTSLHPASLFSIEHPSCRDCVTQSCVLSAFLYSLFSRSQRSVVVVLGTQSSRTHGHPLKFKKNSMITTSKWKNPRHRRLNNSQPSLVVA